MKFSFRRVTVTFLIAAGAVLIFLPREKSSATNVATVSEPGTATTAPIATAPVAPLSGAPFIVQDTENDSPGTNSVTRIVTLQARIGGESPLELQWKVDKGNGFAEIPEATNAIYRIGNAQIEDTGQYALFGRNAAGEIHTTPTPLIVIEVED